MTTRPEPVPEAVVAELYERSADGAPESWTGHYDRAGERWDLTDETHNGEPVMMPWASDDEPMLRGDVEAAYGPLRRIS